MGSQHPLLVAKQKNQTEINLSEEVFFALQLLTLIR